MPNGNHTIFNVYFWGNENVTQGFEGNFTKRLMGEGKGIKYAKKVSSIIHMALMNKQDRF